MLTPTDVHYLVGLLTLVSTPEDVEITLGDMVYDSTADEDRDVDVTVSYKDADGSISVFKGIEVKKHLRPLDVIHVEQLIAKLNDMPSMNHRAIVSSSGYTKPARRKADAYGVELFELVDWKNTMEGFQHVKFAPWLTARQTVFVWASLPVIIFNPNQPIPDEIRSQIKHETCICDATGKVYAECPTVEQFIKNLMFNALNGIREEERINDLPLGTVKDVRIHLEYPDEVYVELREGKLQLKDALIVGQVVKVGSELKPVFKVLVKAGESKPHVGCAIAEIFDGSLIGVTVSQADRNVNMIRIPLSDRNRKKIQMHRWVLVKRAASYHARRGFGSMNFEGEERW